MINLTVKYAPTIPSSNIMNIIPNNGNKVIGENSANETNIKKQIQNACV
jgi:hypothetical protein